MRKKRGKGIKVTLTKAGQENLYKVKNLSKVVGAERYRQMLLAGQSIVRYARTGIEREVKTGFIYKVRGQGNERTLSGRFNRFGPSGAGLRRSKQGRLSKAGDQSSLHQASAPGQFPGIVSGRMINTLDWRSQSDAKYLRIGFVALHARFLELGTSRIAKRPTLARAQQAVEGELFNYLTWKALLDKTRASK